MRQESNKVFSEEVGRAVIRGIGYGERKEGETHEASCGATRNWVREWEEVGWWRKEWLCYIAVSRRACASRKATLCMDMRSKGAPARWQVGFKLFQFLLGCLVFRGYFKQLQSTYGSWELVRIWFKGTFCELISNSAEVTCFIFLCLKRKMGKMVGRCGEDIANRWEKMATRAARAACDSTVREEMGDRGEALNQGGVEEGGATRMLDTWRLYRKPRGYAPMLIKRKHSKT